MQWLESCLQLKRWDAVVESFFAEYRKNYEQIFFQLEQMIETSVLPLWEGYKQNTAGKENRRINTILEFIKKSNILSKSYVRLLEGHVSQDDLGMQGYYIYADGQTIYGKMSAWVKSKAETILKKWS